MEDGRGEEEEERGVGGVGKKGELDLSGEVTKDEAATVAPPKKKKKREEEEDVRQIVGG